MTDRDKLRLAGCHPRLISLVSDILSKFPMFVVVGVRTVAEQQALYAKGRTSPGHIVTNCDGVRSKSNHQFHKDNYGHAVDLAFIGDTPFDPSHPWHDFGSYAKSLGLIWGGDFKPPAPLDLDHIELPDSPGEGH